LGYDPIASAAKGATLAGLEWTEQKVRDLVKQFNNRKLAFLKDADNIELVKEERKSTEFSILKQFVPEAYIIQVQMGLTLRQIAADQVRVQSLRGKIARKYDSKGLHVAEMTQVGIMIQLLTHLSGLYRDPVEVKKRLDYFLDHAEDLAIFVKTSDKPKAVVPLIVARIEAQDAHIMILFGCLSAQNIVNRVLNLLKEEPRNYPFETYQEGEQTIAFIYTPELRAKISHWSESLAS
jgi:hypothetical protein